MLEVKNSINTFDYYQPAEWEAHESCWLAWPSDAELWQENLESSQREFVSLCQAICDVNPLTGEARGEALRVLIGQEHRQQAELALKGLTVQFYDIPFGDIWLRDTAPIFVKNINKSIIKNDNQSDNQNKEERISLCFQFNGWGEKYVLPFDSDVSLKIAQEVAFKEKHFSWILEGGSIETDGEGTVLTTRQCLLNPNRNKKKIISFREDIKNPNKIKLPTGDEEKIEELLKRDLGFNKILWLNEGLINDHTDGHIDTLVRFFAPGKVLCMEACSETDPNRIVLNEIIRDLKQMTDAKGRPLEVVKIPSPGEVLNKEGEIMPASYVNFYISNTSVIVPIYGSPFDREAIEAISKCFPGRKTLGLSAKSILSGGGAFHCITQQVPL